MAYQMSYIDQYDETYPQSYWRPEQWNFSKAGSGMVLFYGYPDAAHKGKRIIGQHQYAVTADDFAAYFTPSALDPLNVNPVKQAYAYALAKQDVKQEDGSMASFFANATEV